MSLSLHCIYASTSGHTAYVVETLRQYLLKKMPKLRITTQVAEKAKMVDFKEGDVLLLASSTWNTGGIEGQLNPHMHALLARTGNVDFKEKLVAIIALGDDRYRYTANAGKHLREFVNAHGGELLGEELTIVNEPYGQEKLVERWGAKIAKLLSKMRDA